MKILFQFTIFLILLSETVFAQNENPDTKLRKPKTSQSNVDTTVTYKANSIKYFIDEQKTYLIGNAQVNYKGTTLTAHKITVDWENDLIFAEGKLDTVYSKEDSAKFYTVLAGEPKFRDGAQTMQGEKLIYNIKTKRGKISKGRTKIEESFYHGKDIAKSEDNTLFIRQGDFTTCDLDTPHYYFRAPKLKMLYKDKVIARPVYLYFKEVPVAVLPFAVIPTNTERRSGIIPPSYAETTDTGRELRELGIYIAPDEYFDLWAISTFKEKSGFEADWKFNYKRRYDLDGLLYGNFSERGSNPFEKTRFWSIGWRHNENVRQKGKINVDLYFSKNNPIRELSPNIEDRLASQKTTSKASYEDYFTRDMIFKVLYENEKNFLGSDLTQERTKFPQFTASYKNNPISFLSEKTTNYTKGVKTRETQTLPSISTRHEDYSLTYFSNKSTTFTKGKKTNVVRSSFPKVTFSKTNIYLFGAPEVVEGSVTERPWYKDIRISGNNFTFERYKSSEVDTLTAFWEDEVHKGAGYSSALQISPKLSYFSITPSFNYNATVVEKYQEGTLIQNDAGEDSVQIDFADGFKVRQTFSTSLRLNTKLYGTRNIGFWKIQQIRHVVDPSITYTYAPDFSEKFWGNFQEVKNENGEVVGRIDKFGGNKTGIVGATQSSKTKKLDFGLGNKFQMKYWSGDSTSATEKRKADLFDLNLSSSYNFEADSLKLANLQSTLTARPFPNFNTTIKTTHTFYAFGSKKYLFETDKTKIAHLTDLDLDLSFTLKGGNEAEINAPVVSETEKSKSDLFGFTPTQLHDKSGNLALRNDSIENLRVPWKLKTAISWGMDRPTRIGGKFAKTSQMSVDFAAQPTRNWTLSYVAAYDLVKRIIRSHEFNFVRTLHKWKLGFRWVPYGFNAGYFLKIGLDSPQLRDLKIQTHEGNLISDPF